MLNHLKKFNTIQIVELLLTCIVGIVFITVPFVKVGSDYVTAFYFPMSLIIGLIQLAIGNSVSATIFDNLMKERALQVTLTIAVFLLWYIILYYVIRTLYCFFKGKNGRFSKIARRGFLADIIITVLFFIVRIVIIHTIINDLPQYIGSYTNYVASGSDYGFTPEPGFYTIFLLGIVGYILPKFGLNLNRKRQKAKIAKQEKKKQPQVTSNSETLVTLEHPNGNIYIHDFPSVIGSGNDAKIIINDSSLNSRHLIIQEYKNHIVVSDLKSYNGTYLNNEKLQPDQFYIIKPGDKLRIGNLDFAVKL